MQRQRIEKGIYRARDAASGMVVADRLSAAHTHWRRLKGLLGTRALEPGQGLWLKPCRQVHTFGMRYALDLVFLDENGRIVQTLAGLGANKISPSISGAASVLELPAGALQKTGLTPGARIEIDGVSGSDSPLRINGVAAAACNLVLAALYGMFAAVHFQSAQSSGNWFTAMPIVVQETLLVGLFLTRRRSISTSNRLRDWVIGVAGTFLPFLLRPVEPIGPLGWLGQPLQMLGLSFAVAGLISLGRSIGIVAANRGIKSSGPYRLVRHPMYAAYIVTFMGYAASYPTARNCLILLATAFLLNARAVAEERLLGRDPVYADYLRRVRWRFAPYLY